MNFSLVFDPAIPPAALAAAGAAALALCVLAALMRSPGWALRGLAFALLIFALASPFLLREERRALSDIVFLITDKSDSQSIGGRLAETEEAERGLRERIQALAGAGADAPLELREVTVSNDEAGGGTMLLGALERAAAEVPAARIAGALLITDGAAHDADALTAFPAPVHALISGSRGAFDRRLNVTAAPGFGVVGETVSFEFTVEESGAPAGVPARVTISIDGEIIGAAEVAPGRSASFEVMISHGGANVAELSLAPLEGEITTRNNRAAFTVNGVRDRLRVLLVSGEPYSGERTWRNLLKSDPSVDLVHFTILRPPEKQDGTPVIELSLIAFPTRELFLEKVDEFDLIIFDRYRRRGVLPASYIANISRYVRDGGAVLIAAGPWFAGVESLWRTPLSDVLPVEPVAGLIEGAFLPRLSETGLRHPVTAGLDGAGAGDEPPSWGRWLRQTGLRVISGEALMTGADGLPLLVLDRVGEGRVAVIGSDQAWLWSRGYEGGGPQAELLRRLAHWLMKEPELEEETLSALAEGGKLMVTRRSISETPEALEAQSPSGEIIRAPFEADGPGLWRAEVDAAEEGLWRLSDGRLSTVAAAGAPWPEEFEQAVSTDEILAPLVNATGGGVFWLEDGLPGVRRVVEGRSAAGRNWLGLAKREAYAVDDIRLTPLAPAWLMLLLAMALMLGAWRLEGR